MKKITSFLMMVVLCCSGAIAQDVVGTELPTDKYVKIGTAQSEVVPGQWYVLHNSRPSSGAAQDFVIPGETIPGTGGLVSDEGIGRAMKMSPSSVISEMDGDLGVNPNNYKKHFVRFVAVEGKENVYNIQFATNNWIGSTLTTVTNNQYLAGQAGEYNFYLVTIGDTPNALGRFAWNKFDMANRVDNNGAGNTVSFWSEGIITGENHEWTSEDQITGNKIWQVYDIHVLGDIDFYNEAFTTLVGHYNTIISQQEGAFIDNIQNGIGVGEEPGYFRPEYVEAFLALHNQIDELILACDMEGTYAPLQAEYHTQADLNSLIERYLDVFNALVENIVPHGMTNIVPGYYTVNSVMDWFTVEQDSTFYTVEEADSINSINGAVEGDSLYIAAGDFKVIVSDTIPQPIKALCSRDNEGQGWLAWGNLEENAEYLWKIEATDKPNEYKFTNMFRRSTFESVNTSTNVQLTSSDSATVCFDWRGDNVIAPITGKAVTVVNIRSASQAANSLVYLHCGGHGLGRGQQGWIVGWSSGGSSDWYLNPVDEATANEWMAEGDVALEVINKVAKGDSIAEVVPAQIEIAKDIVTTLHEADSVVVTADQFYSQFTTTDQQNIPDGQTVYDFLIDGNQRTYWHSEWENGSVAQKVHYLQIRANETLEGLFAVKMQRRPVYNDHVTQLIVKGYTEEPTDETTFDEGTELAVLDFPLGANNETLASKAFDATGMNYLRFYSTTTEAISGGASTSRGYWHASAFNVYKATSAKRYETVQADVRAAEIAALEAAVAAWEEKAFSADSLGLVSDPTFEAAYNTLVAAYEAWSNVYVDPTELRNAIADVPERDLFVIGNNPGQWTEEANALYDAVEDAEEFNASGAYTKEENEEHLFAILNAQNNAFETANKVETGKWYRFSFPTEQMYETYGWNMVPASSVVHEITGTELSKELFGKRIAPGAAVIGYKGFEQYSGVNDTVAYYNVSEADYLVEGNGLFMFGDDTEFENGEDLFRFIETEDSRFIIQNKATGLYLRVGDEVTLSAIPSYFTVNAIGAGVNVINHSDIFGNVPGGRMSLHAERSTNKVVAWNYSELGSNSMFCIEEVEEVTEEPTATYIQKMWPGKFYAYTMPVDVTVGSDAKAYGAEFKVENGTQTVIMKEFTEMPIMAGTPFILVANLNGEYISEEERLSQIASEVLAEEGRYGLNERVYAAGILDSEYAMVELSHGSTISTEIAKLDDLVGCYVDTYVAAGKGLFVSDNSFAHNVTSTFAEAYSAYFECDFDPNGVEVVTPINIQYGEFSDNPGDYSNVIYGEDVEIFARYDAVLPILMNNTEDIISWEFELDLPDGVSIKKDENNNYMVEFENTRSHAHEMLIRENSNGNITIAAYSWENAVLEGTSGVIANVHVVLDENVVKGDYIVSCNNIAMTKANASEYFSVVHVKSKINLDYNVGDVNVDGTINITDISAGISLWLGNVSAALFRPAADVTCDGILDVTDISQIVDLFMGIYESRRSAARNAQAENVTTCSPMYMDLTDVKAGEIVEMPVRLDNAGVSVVSAQFDLYLPEGIEVVSDMDDSYEIVAGSRLNNHNVLTRKNLDGSVRIAAYSMSNEAFAGDSGDIFVIKLKVAENVAEGAYEVKLTNQVLTNSDIIGMKPADFKSNLQISVETGINGVKGSDAEQSIYDMQGRRTDAKQRGIYIKNGKKVIVK